MKDFKIDFGWSADPIPEQIAAQGLRIKKKNLKLRLRSLILIVNLLSE